MKQLLFPYQNQSLHGHFNFKITPQELIYTQKQSPGGTLQKNYSYKFLKFTEKHLCRILFFNKVVGCSPATSSKKEERLIFSTVFCQIFQNSLFIEHLTTVAFVSIKKQPNFQNQSINHM